jgi:DNA transformation protein and related proteins
MRVLRAAGISTRADLERLGPVKAYLAAKRVEPRVTLNLLWGIAGALIDKHWSKLSAQYRSELLLEYDGQLDAERALAARGEGAVKAKRGRARRSAKPPARRRNAVGS